MLALVACALVVVLAPTLQGFLAQRAQRQALSAQIRAAQARVEALSAEQARWSDPAYVRQQARERLHFVMPGQTQYVVLGAPAAAGGSTSASGPGTAASADGAWAGASTEPAARPWYADLWSSVLTADRTPPAPADGSR